MCVGVCACLPFAQYSSRGADSAYTRIAAGQARDFDPRSRS